ncbi:transmembrane protein fuseless isoform X1 [Lycorma delicatula]
MRGSTAGITDGLRGTSKAHYAVLTVLDMILSALFISPLVVTYWRGTWCIMDYYVYPDRPDYSSYVSLGIGLSVLLFFTLLQGPITENLHPDKHRLTYYLLSRLYTAIFGFSCVNSWRGAWIFLDVFTGDSPDTVLATTLTSALLLGCLRSLRNISAPPFAIVTDRREGYFEVPTMFRISGSRDTWLYILDCFFSVFIIGTLVVFVWRGVWCLLDIYLFPDREDLSAWGSLAMGYILVFSTFATQPLVKSLVIRVSGFWRLLTVDIYLIFSFCGTVNVWRGVWNLLNLYFLPDRKVMSYWVTHVACFLLLVFINSSNSILVRGVYIDAEEDGAQCVDFPCYYLRLFFQARRRKKLLRQLKKRQIANLVGKKSETDVFPVPVVQDGIEKTPIQVVDPSQAV